MSLAARLDKLPVDGVDTADSKVAHDTFNGVTFVPVPVITDLSVALGIEANMMFATTDLPVVPVEFMKLANDYLWGAGRLPLVRFEVDRTKARRLISGFLNSMAPNKVKVTTVAYALWVWSKKSELTVKDSLTVGGLEYVPGAAGSGERS